MAELITIFIDIALGALAYRLAYENKREIEALKGQVDVALAALRKAGLLD